MRDIKISLGTILTGVSVGAGALYIASLYRLAKKVQVSVEPRVHKLDFTGVSIVSDIRIINPTSGTLTIRHPYISLFASPEMEKKRMPFANNEVSNQTHTIVPFGTTNIQLPIKITMADLLSIGADLVKDGKIELVINVKTKATTKWLIGAEVDKSVQLPFDISVIKNMLQQKRVEQQISQGIEVTKGTLEGLSFISFN